MIGNGAGQIGVALDRRYVRQAGEIEHDIGFVLDAVGLDDLGGECLAELHLQCMKGRGADVARLVRGADEVGSTVGIAAVAGDAAVDQAPGRVQICGGETHGRAHAIGVEWP